MTAPAWLLDSDADELADLAAVGIDLNQPMSDANLDAAASHLLGKMADDTRDVMRYTEARDAEVARIRARYESLITPISARMLSYEEAVREIALRADFGKKKSRTVGNGSYGVRSVPERVEITDKALALEWAKQHCPGAVQVETVEKISHKAIAPAILARVHANGEQPDGFEVHAAHDSPFAKVEI